MSKGVNVMARQVSEIQRLDEGRYRLTLECGHRTLYILNQSRLRQRRTMPCARCQAILIRRLAKGDKQADIARALHASRALISKWALRIEKGNIEKENI